MKYLPRLGKFFCWKNGPNIEPVFHVWCALFKDLLYKKYISDYSRFSHDSRLRYASETIQRPYLLFINEGYNFGNFSPVWFSWKKDSEIIC